MEGTKDFKRTLAAPDNLQLEKISIPEEIIFPDELNRYLRDQVQYLTHENGMLVKNLSEVETELKRSESKINDLSSQLNERQTTCSKTNTLSPVSNLTSKIVELSKKLRERNAEIEVVKTKCHKLEHRIVELEKTEQEPKAVPKVETPKNEMETQIQSLQDRLNATNTRLCEIRNSNAQLKNDLKMANKLLHQEVGENLDIVQNLKWRGRAQMICDLQNKNAELKEKLKTSHENDKRGAISQEFATPTSKPNKRIDALMKANDELRNTLQETTRKFEASKARNRVLESESGSLRGKVSQYTEQSVQDQDMIVSLTTKVSQAQAMQNEAVRQKQITIQRLQQENKNLQMDLIKQKCKVDNYQGKIDTQSREIENLRQKVKKQLPLSPTKNVVAIETTALNQLEGERVRLLELSEMYNKRLETEKTDHMTTQKKFRAERHKAARLEAKVARFTLEQMGDYKSSYSLNSLQSRESDFTIEDKLQLAEETVKALDTRLEVERREHKTDLEEFRKILGNYSIGVKEYKQIDGA